MKAKLISFSIATLIRAIGLTMRWRLVDRSGVSSNDHPGPLIWVFWHNRVFGMPFVYRKFLHRRHGSVLTSPSGDGELIALVMARFGVGSIRGSSNKRPAAAVREIVSFIGQGGDVAITPDGPRGPVYQMQPGVIKMAQLSGVPVLPIRLRYHRALSLKTWDRFQIPLPFSKAEVVFEELQNIPRRLDEERFEATREGLERILRAGA